MEAPPVIQVEGLGKRYTLGTGSGERYVALRDVLANSARRLLGRRREDSAASGADSEFWALKDVSFEVKQGEVVGIIGRNGAGKSTLLKVLSRITDPTEGRIKLRGRVASLLEVGTGFHPELTGRENIFLNGAILGMHRREIRAKFDEIVAFAEVERFLDTPVKRYSSGMYVRLAFAVAAHLEPEILVVDEVLAVGDIDFQRKCLGKMESVARREGRTVLFVSHNMAAVKTLCTRLVYLKTGRVYQTGAVDAVIADYLADSKTLAEAVPGAARRLDDNLELLRLDVSPNPVRTGESVTFHIELGAIEKTRLMEAAVLIYSSLGARVAILDLRAIGQPYITPGQPPLVIQTETRNVPLVEGTYHLGLYLKTEASSNNFVEVSHLEVSASTHASSQNSYPPEHRGFVELDYTLRH